MGRLQVSLTAAAALALGSGCAGAKWWKGSETAKVPEGIPTAPLSSLAQSNSIVQASATVPASSTLSSMPSWAKLTGKVAKVQPVEMTVLWRNKIDYLPDPSPEKNGQMGAGLVGQLFLFGPGMVPASPEGKLTVALYDESPRPAGQPANLPEGWEFDGETLKKLVTGDERFGRCYALFLPWPTYRPDVTRVRIAVQFDPENGHRLYAGETRITLDNSGGAGTEWSSQQVVPGAQPPGGFSPLGGPPPSGPSIAPPGSFNPGPAGSVPLGNPGVSPGASLPMGTLTPAPPGYGALAPVPQGAPGAFGGPPGPGGAGAATIPPGGLPPFAIVAPGR
jgi:hypothetical protein